MSLSYNPRVAVDPHSEVTRRERLIQRRRELSKVHRLGVPSRPYRRNPDAAAKQLARYEAMGDLYKSGKTLGEIGEIYGVSDKFIHNCLRRIGISYLDGGRLKLAADRRALRLVQRNDLCFKRYGCSWEDYLPLRGFVTNAYCNQKNQARRRGVGWDLTLLQWWDFWQQSGHWEDRGAGQGYMMCRIGDKGPYALGNIYAATGCENSSIKHGRIPDLPRGVTRMGNRFSAQRCVGGIKLSLGDYPTPELAHAAYLAAGELS